MMIYHFRENELSTVESSLLIDLIQNNQAEAYRHFEKLIKIFSIKLGYEDAVGEFNLFFFELINGIDLKRFAADDTDGLCRYIKKALKYEYIHLVKKRQIEEFNSCELDENIIDIKVNFRAKIETVDLLTALTQKQREILYYRYFYRLSCAEIGEILGISRQAVNGLKKRALKILKEIMK